MLVAVLALAMSASPSFTLWVWDAPNDLSFVPDDVTLAVFAGEVHIAADETWSMRRRAQKVRGLSGRAVTVVFRLTTGGRGIPEGSVDALATELLDRMKAFDSLSLQIDFDAQPGEYSDYRRLLVNLRARTKAKLSITALASWCREEWLHDLPVSQVVPQLFRLGRDAATWRARFETGDELKGCGTSVGISTDEFTKPIAAAREVFIFRPGTWTPEAFVQIQERWK